MNVELKTFQSRWCGHVLKRDLRNGQGVLVLSAHTKLTKTHVNKIAFHGIKLTERDLVKPEAPFISPHLHNLEQSMTQVEGIFKDIRHTASIPILHIRQAIMPVIREAASHPRLFDLLSQLQTQDDYTYRHNISVGVIAGLIGTWLGLSESELAILTVGATLHDVGKMQVPPDILNKKGRLSEEEYGIMKKHTFHGYKLIKSTIGLSDRSALIALQHHEREDGSGYPFGLTGAQVDPLSKIVAIADVFHAMTSKRPYKEAIPFHIILKRMYQGTLGRFDMDILKLFSDKLMNKLVGSEVRLNNGHIAKVVMMNPLDITKPLVQIEDTFIDLSKHGSLNMMHVIG